MASVQERLKLKRVPYDTWSTREQLCLASSVLRSGDQNWISVSRSLKPFTEKEALRPPDWFSTKSCAVQYAHLIENADAPKRKKRESGETTGESIVRRLTQERVAELRQILAFQRDEYQQLKAEVNLLRSGPLSDEKLQKMWHAIELEEREQEQKARAHAAWLAKRQQKQEVQSAQSISLNIQRKPGENASENQEAMDTFSTNDDEKKNKDGRSPLLTSLLKSPSPTTQIQTQATPAQTSPTIASLLGSSPKVPNPQLTQSVSPQLQQLVSSAIASAVPERPSAGAPTLSMLLELPANSQRGPLPQLQTATSKVMPHTVPSDFHIQSRTNNHLTNQNVVQMVQASPIPTPNIPVTESMVQIIDHMDDVIHKDIMANVIDKDEINEIIGDIEELIKEEITASPRIMDSSATTSVVESLSLPLCQDSMEERQQPRNVDDPISLSDSAESEMAIGEIDSSTSNIAEIIGTVAVEATQSKVIARNSPDVSQNVEKESKNALIAVTEVTAADNEPMLEKEVDKIFEDRNSPVEEKSTILEDHRNSEKVTETITADSKESESQDKKELAIGKPDGESTEEKSTLVEHEEESSCDTSSDHKEIPEDMQNRDTSDLDQLELHLAEITGDSQDGPPAGNFASISSESTNELPNAEEEKSQDISLILEDDESSENSRDKSRDLPMKNVTEDSEPSEGSKKESTSTPTEEPTVSIQEESTTMVKEESTSEVEDDPQDVKKENLKDIVDDALCFPSQEAQIKKEELSEKAVMDTSKPLVILENKKVVIKEQAEENEPLRAEDKDVSMKQVETSIVQKSEDTKPDEKSYMQEKLSTIEEEPKQEEKELKEVKAEKQETKELADAEQIVKKEAPESVESVGDDIGELDEEESGLNKLNSGRAMKTYSKKQSTMVDSEPENEGSGEGADYRAWKKAVMLVFNRLATHKYASVFLRPITEDHAPGYHSVIFRPMDLSTIKKNIDNGTIRSTMHFQRDVMLMFQNAIMYNKQDTFVYKMAVSMQEECLQHLQILVQVTGEGPFRRETRTAASCSSDMNEAGAKRKRSHITPSPLDTDSPRAKKRIKSEND